MKFIPPKIVDDFLEDPDYIREIALSCEYKTYSDAGLGEGKWPGKRSGFLHDILDPEVYFKLSSKIFDLYDLSKKNNYYIESNFQLCTSEDDTTSWIHQDPVDEFDYASVIYLTPNPPKKSGTIIYEPVDCNFNAYQWENESNYKVKQRVDNVYNRLVSYDVREFHKSDTYFGDNINNGRLFIVSFFKKVD